MTRLVGTTKEHRLFLEVLFLQHTLWYEETPRNLP